MAEGKTFYMNPRMGRHLGGETAKPEREPDEAREKTSGLTCPECGAKLTVEAEPLEEERREAESKSEGVEGVY